MKLSQTEVFEIVNRLKPSRFVLPDVNTVSVEIANILGVVVDESLKVVVKNQLRAFTKLNQSKKKRTSSDRLDVSSDTVLDSKDFNEIDAEVENETTKRHRKDFRNLGKKMQRERTQGLVDAIHQFIQNEDGTLTENEVLGYLLYRFNYSKSKEIANLGSDLFHNTYQAASYNVHEAVSIMHSLVLSKEQMRTMKRIMMSKGIYFPNTNEINEARKKLRPVSNGVLENKGVAVDYYECVENTVSGIFEVLNETGKTVESDSSITVFFKDGCDGAGQQVVWKSCSMKNAEQNMFQYGVVPLKVLSNDKMVWQNHSPNSPECLRPIYLIREKESDEEMIELVIKTTDQARSNMMKNGNEVNYGDKQFHVNIVIFDTMKDLKLKKSISGLGGADCILCESKAEDWVKEENVLNGFDVSRSSRNTMDLYNELVQDGDILKRQGDFDTRKGLTKKPITSSDQHSITITHSYINVTTWFLKLLYRMNSEYFVWRECKTVLGEHIRRGKERVFDIILENTGLVLDVVCSGGAKGGTSTDGKQGRRFFSHELVSSIKLCIKEKYHNNVLKLHELLSVILRVVSSQQMVNLTLYKEICLDASLLIARSFPWARINHTLHGLLHHSTQLIELNDSYALGSLSEEGLESANKHIRRYLEILSRKTSPLEQMTDVLNRLLERSNPIVSYRASKLKKQRIVCLECGSNSHTIRGHQRSIMGPKNSYDSLVENILIL